MRGIYLVLFLVIVGSLIGCGTVPGPAPVSVGSQTPTVQSLFIPEPSATAVIESNEGEKGREDSGTPTSTPEIPLRTSGPYFAYFREVDEVCQLVMVDANGQGMKIIDLPKEVVEGYPSERYVLGMKLVSPDGHWLAFYTGFAGEVWGATTPSYDLSLNLLDLRTGETKVVTPLLSANYPDNFTQAAAKLGNPEITAESLKDAFLGGIVHSLAWSPDGQHLAFAGQMDGLSSDLYVYDLKSEKIRRLSSGDQELQSLNWSSDGKWIVHSSVFWVGEGMDFDIYAAAVDGSSVRHLSNCSSCWPNYGMTWLNPHTYLEYDSANGSGNYGLRSVDIETGKVRTIWEGSFYTYTPNQTGTLVVVGAITPRMDMYSSDDPGFVPGPYLVDTATLRKTKVEVPANEAFVGYSYGAVPFDQEGQEFILLGEKSNSYFLSEKLELTPLDLKGNQIAVSPDSNYWAIVTEKAIDIYSRDSVLVHSFPLSRQHPWGSNLTWSPDSSGLFVLYENNIYFLDIPNGQMKVLETHLSERNLGPAYLWVNEQ